MTTTNDCDPERAALFALGALDVRASDAFTHHLEAGCAVCRAELDGFDVVGASLALAVPPVAPPPALRSRVLAAVRSTDRALHFVGSDEGTWVTIEPGIEKKDLSAGVAGAPSIFLLRLAPGIVASTHDHARTEDCYVLGGDLRVGARHLHTGDHHRAEVGSTHTGLVSDGGALLLIVEGRA